MSTDPRTFSPTPFMIGAVPDQPAPRQVDRYEILSSIGEGGMATVYHARFQAPGGATKQVALAEMFIKLEQTRNLFLRAITDARVDPPKSARLRAYAAQYTIMENAQDLARLAIRTCGGQSMLKSLPLERLYRDARCGSLMLPWTAELCMDRIGREALYEAGETDA